MLSRRYTFRDNHGRAGGAAGLLAACAAINLVQAGLCAWILANLGDPALEQIDGFAQGLGVANFGALAVTAVVFILWLRRAWANGAASGMRSRWSAGWTIGCWFVPVANLWIPFQVVRDVFVHALPRRGAGLVGVWWATWLVGRILDNVSTRMFDAGYAEPLVTAALLVGIAGSVLDAVGALCAIAIVRRVTAAQQAPVDEATLDVFGEAQPPLPQPAARP